MQNAKECGMQTEIYSRVVGYYRPVQNWNKGKKEEFGIRRTFSLNEKTVETTTCTGETPREKATASL